MCENVLVGLEGSVRERVGRLEGSVRERVGRFGGECARACW